MDIKTYVGLWLLFCFMLWFVIFETLLLVSLPNDIGEHMFSFLQRLDFLLKWLFFTKLCFLYFLNLKWLMEPFTIKIFSIVETNLSSLIFGGKLHIYIHNKRIAETPFLLISPIWDFIIQREVDNSRIKIVGIEFEERINRRQKTEILFWIIFQFTYMMDSLGLQSCCNCIYHDESFNIIAVVHSAS